LNRLRSTGAGSFSRVRTVGSEFSKRPHHLVCLATPPRPPSQRRGKSYASLSGSSARCHVSMPLSPSHTFFRWHATDCSFDGYPPVPVDARCDLDGGKNLRLGRP